MYSDMTDEETQLAFIAGLRTDAAALQSALSGKSALGVDASKDPIIIAKANAITSGLNSDYEKLLAIHDFVSENIWYDHDEAAGSLSTGEGEVWTLENKRGICADYAGLSKALLRAVGVPTIFVGGSNHVWNASFADGRWIQFDTTWDSNNDWEYGQRVNENSLAASHDYFDEANNVLLNHKVVLQSDEGVGLYVVDNVLMHAGLAPSEKSVQIPDGVTKLDLAFFFNEYIENISIPSSVTIIGNGSFVGCSKLKTVEIANGVAEIGDSAFADCVSLESISIPESVQKIGQGIFNGCKSLQTISFPNNIEQIERYTFYGCSSLERIVFSNNLRYIGESAFEDCIKLAEIKLPKSEIEIDANAFRNCDSLKTIEIPARAQISGWSFAYCDSLESVIIDDEVKALGDFAFRDSVALKKAYIPASTTTINDAFDACNNVTIYGIEGSAAEVYANDKGYPFVNENFTTNNNVDSITETGTPSTWAKESVDKAKIRGLATNDLTNGYQVATTRAEFCRAAVNFLRKYGYDVDSVTPKLFADTSDKDIGIAAALAITSGTDTTKNLFSPDGTLTREQAATMLRNVMNVIGTDTTPPPGILWTDAKDISSWAQTAADVMYSAKVMGGTSTTALVFSPKTPYTHEQSIITLVNLWEYVK
ncbi:hypothetical protein FACS18949_05420 [Clostridia bacterium]|nr:hypothetical protein FACS18949_05420 [Clostridia bacterium]